MEDDDMVLVIIGEEADSINQKDQSCVLDDAEIAEPDVNAILDKVTKHGEYLEVNLSDEEYNVEYQDGEFPCKMPVENFQKAYNESNFKVTLDQGYNKDHIRKGHKDIKDFRSAGNIQPVGIKYYCTMCPASFSRKATVVAHENSHVGLRPYHCDTCPAAYTSEVALRRHLQTHTDSQFICDHCGSAFKFKKVLVNHMHTHRPLRKYPCEHCPRRFAQKVAMLHHCNRVHLNLPPAHACPVCSKRYARMSLVRDHMKKAHELSMITRRMFYECLPTLTNLELVEPAKIVSIWET